MGDRAQLIDAFLGGTIWANWTVTPMAGDASARRYFRLSDSEHSVILMDAPPQNGEDTQPFAKIASLLGDAGFYPPEILAHDPAQGFMVLSDLGRYDYPRWLSRHADDETRIYRAAVDVLVHLQSQDFDLPLAQMTPNIAADMITVTGEYYASGADVADLQEAVRDHFIAHAPLADTLSLRDFHAENLIWRPDHSGLARVGLLDFQDAFWAPAGYDLASLLRDVRRNVSDDLARDMTDHYIQATAADADFPIQLACLGAQRNLRILGVFTRLAQSRGKPHYLDFMPHVWTNLMRDLNHPALRQLRQATLDCLPAPDIDLLNRLRA